jgi:hypothetical protein
LIFNSQEKSVRDGQFVLIAHNSLHYGVEYPSQIVLPVRHLDK